MAANNTTDLKNGVVGEVGCKYPATVASLTNITLEGYQTINGVSVTDEMIVLVRGQADKTENGIYVPSTGEWQRAVWFDDELDATSGTLVFTSLGTLYADTLWRTVCTDDPIVFGTSEIEFEIIVSGDNTGDITLTGEDYLTLVNQALTANKISLANMANLAANSFIGNNTGSPATPIALTAAQATAALDVMVGDGGSGGTKGLVPAPAAGDAALSKYLKADSTWETPPVSNLPIGIILGWDSSTPPTDFLSLDGSTVLIANIPFLAPVIYCGDANNATADYYYKFTNPANPNGSRSTAGTYILLKDTSGRFARGWKNGQTIDSGRAFNSYQDDAFQGHYHSTVLQTGHETLNHYDSGQVAGGNGGGSAVNGTIRLPVTDGASGTPRTTTETRPTNYTEIKIIKYQ